MTASFILGSRLIFLLACSLFAAAQGASSAPRFADVAAVKAREEAFRQAELHYDTAAAEAILADEFVGTGNNGELFNKQKFLSLVGDKADPLEALEYGEMEVRVYGDAAVVWSTMHEKAIYGGKVDESHGRRTAMWVRRDSRWQCVAIHTSAFRESGGENK